MKHSEHTQTSLPDDIVIKIASFLELPDLCALGCCSRFWRELCRSDFIWKSLSRKRWPFLSLFDDSESKNSEFPHIIDPSVKGWRRFYIKQHTEMSRRAMSVIKFVEERSPADSLEVGDYLKAIEDMSLMQLGFKDVQMFLFKPRLNVFHNLVGLHYCINWLQVPATYVLEVLQSCEISERQVCVRWWKLGRWSYGFRMRDESHSRWVCLADLATAKEEEVLAILHRGAIHEVLRVQISMANSTSSPWSSQSTERLG
ncbi:hypothetical protein SLE2022_166540 [Rubroshorea leprosula]